MNTPPADSHFGFISPLAPQLARFLALKHAIGHRYREEGRVLHDLDCFLNSRLSANDPVITSAMVHDYVARRGDESETTRAHRLTLIREVCRLLRLDNARVVVPDRRSLRIVRSKFVPRVLSRDEGRRFLQACAELSPGRTSPIRAVVLGTTLRVLYLVGLWAGELLRLTQADVEFDAGTLHIRHTKDDKSRVVLLTPDLVTRLVHCRTRTVDHFGSCLPQTPFFSNPRGGRYSITALRDAFHQVLKSAGIERTSNSRIRLHDLRQHADSRIMQTLAT
jgi:integrase